MQRAVTIAAAAAVGLVTLAFFFYLIAGVFYDSLPHGMMPGVGNAVMIVAGGLIGAFSGAITAGFGSRASEWIAILLSAMLGAFMAATEFGSLPRPLLTMACTTTAGAFAGWVVAIVGKKMGRPS
jgi:hypothetical protein